MADNEEGERYPNEKEEKKTFISIRITLVILFCQTEIVLKDSTAFVYVTKSEKSSHFTLTT